MDYSLEDYLTVSHIINLFMCIFLYFSVFSGLILLLLHHYFDLYAISVHVRVLVFVLLADAKCTITFMNKFIFIVFMYNLFSGINYYHLHCFRQNTVILPCFSFCFLLIDIFDVTFQCMQS